MKRTTASLSFLLSLSLFTALGCSSGDDGQGAGVNASTSDGDLVGITNASITVDAMGQASVAVPLDVLPAGNGMEPSLVLAYHSGTEGATNVGYGWSLGPFPTITRCGATVRVDGADRAVDLTSGDAVCLDGQRLILVGGKNLEEGAEYRLQRDDFSRVRYVKAGDGGGAFVVSKKGGETIALGATKAARAVHGSGVTLGWHAETVTDRSGNGVTITYDNDAAARELRVAEIAYGGNRAGNVAPYRTARFVYEDAQSPVVTYAQGEAYTHGKRLARVELASGGDVAKSYKISYAPIPHGTGEVLASVQTCFTGTSCFPATRFDYDLTAPSFESEKLLGTVYRPADAAVRDATIRKIIDVDNDGHDDLVSVNRLEVVVQRWTKAGYEAPRSAPSGLPASWSSRRDAAFFYDLNGDGYVDMLTTVTKQFGTTVTTEMTGLYAMMGGANGFSPATQVSKAFGEGTDPRSLYMMMGDADHDGRADLFAFGVDGVLLYLSKGDRFEPATASGIVLADLGAKQGYKFTAHPRDVADVNGDGLLDLLAYGDTDVMVSLGHGTTFDAPTSWSRDFVANAGAMSFGMDNHIRLLTDVNADGLPDIVGYHTQGVYVGLNTGKGFAPAKLWVNDFGTAQGFTEAAQMRTVTDVNGDGFVDFVALAQSKLRVVLGNGLPVGDVATLDAHRQFVVATPAGGGFRQWTRGQHPLAMNDVDSDGLTDIQAFVPAGVVGLKNTSTPLRLTKVVDGLGKTTRITYAPGSSPDVYTRTRDLAYPLVTLPSVGRLVSQLEESDGVGGIRTLRYQYENGAMHRLGLGFIGFETWRTFDVTSNVQTVTRYSMDPDGVTTSMPLVSETARVVNGVRTLLSTSTTTWESRKMSANDAHRFAFPKTTEATQNDDDGSFLAQTRTDQDFDAYGNNVSTVSTSKDASGEQTVATTQTFETEDAANWILGRVTTATVVATATGSTPVTTRARFTYDSAGRLREEIREPGTSFELRTTSSRDNPFGIVDGVTKTWSADQGKGLAFTSTQVRTEIDARGFVRATINALGHRSEIVERHPAYGVPTQTKDANGLVSRVRLDVSGQAVEATAPTGVVTRTTRRICGDTCPRGAVFETRVERDGTGPTLSYSDLLGRTVRVEGAGLGGKRVVVDTEYASHGQVARTSRPYFADAAAGDIAWTVNVYDASLRLREIRSPDGARESVDHKGTTAVETDARGGATTQVMDTRGRVQTITDATGATLTYRYDAAGRADRIVDAKGNTTTFAYDLLGRRVKITDPDTGTTTTTLNAFGLAAETKDAAGFVMRASYDALGRITARAEHFGAADAESSTWVYDTAKNGIGLPASESNPSATRTFEYDALSRASASTLVVSGKTYRTTQSYDKLGRPQAMVYPSGLSAENVYDDSGVLYEIRNGTSKRVYYHLDSTYASGSPALYHSGNGLATMLAENAKSGLLEGSQVTKADGSVVFAQRYAYDASRNLTKRRDDVTQLEESFEYDGANRLTSITNAKFGKKTISYDATGNIDTRSGVGTYVYGETCDGIAAGPHAVTHIGSKTYCYNAKGQMVRGDGRTVRYGAHDLPIAFARGNDHVEIRYGASGERVEQVSTTGGAVSTVRYGAQGFEEIEASDGVTQRHMLGGGVIVTTRNGQDVESYVTVDHIGSVSLVTDVSGAVTERLSYDAWGQRRDATGGDILASYAPGTTPRGFTGHEHLDGIGLVHMGGRVYDAEIGRFVSPDPFVQDPTNAQSLNRYSYVWNNPLSATDPSGYFSLKSLGKAIDKLGKAFANPGRSLSRAGGRLSKWTKNPQNQRMVASMAIAITAACLAPYAAASFVSWQAWAVQAAVVGAGGYASGYVASDGNLEYARKSALTAIAFQTVGFAFKGVEMTAPMQVAKAAAHGVVGGVTSLAHGGTFESGFLTSSVTEALSLRGVFKDVANSAGVSPTNLAYMAASSALVSGTMAEMTGGTFENGAMTGAFASLFNHGVSSGLSYGTNAMDAVKGLFKNLGNAFSAEATLKGTLGVEEVSINSSGEVSYGASAAGRAFRGSFTGFEVEAGLGSLGLNEAGDLKVGVGPSVGTGKVSVLGQSVGLEGKLGVGIVVLGPSAGLMDVGGSAEAAVGFGKVSIEAKVKVDLPMAARMTEDAAVKALTPPVTDFVNSLMNQVGIP